MSRPQRLVVLRQQVVVVEGVVRPVDEQVHAVDPEPGRLRHVGGEDLDLVAGVDPDRRAVLAADQDGLALALPQVAVVLDQVVEPGHTGLGVGELDRAVRTGDGGQTILGEDERRTDMRDVAGTQRDHQHGAVVLAGSVGVVRVEAGVARDPEGLALDRIDQLAVLVVGRHRCRDALEGTVDLLAEGAETSTASEQHHCHYCGDDGGHTTESTHYLS